MINVEEQTKLVSLAPSQIPEWYAYQLYPDSPVYNISFNHYFFKNIDPNLFLIAWQHIIDRHDVFKIKFTIHNGEAKQFLENSVKLKMDDLLIDRKSIDVSSVLEEQNKLATYYANKPFNFDQAGLFRLHLIAYPDNEYQLIFTVHHIIWDETSTINLIKEFTEIYNWLVIRGSITHLTLPILSTNYLDVVAQQVHTLDSGLYNNHKAYWLKLFEKMPESLKFPLDFPRPAYQTYDGNTINAWLPKALIYQAKKFCIEYQASLFALFMSVLGLYVYRITGQDDFVIGCPIAGRDSNTKNLLGCFAVPLPIRFKCVSNNTFLEFMDFIKERVYLAFEHYHYPCVRVIEELSHQKDLSRPKLFSIMAGLQNDKTDFLEIKLENGKFYAKEIFSAENHGARFDLAIGLDPLGGDVRFFCTYNTDLFKESTVKRIMNDVTYLFQEVVNKPNLQLSEYSLLSIERYEEMIRFSCGQKITFSKKTVVDLFLQQVTLTPQHSAIVFDGKVITYEQLYNRMNKLMSSLLNAGFGVGDKIAVLQLPTDDLVISLMAILGIGASYVPLNPNDPWQRLLKIKEQISWRGIVTHSSLVGTYKFANDTVILVDETDGCIENSVVVQKSKEEHIAYIIFTSGTTGQPKGIPICHHGLTNLIEATQTKYQMTQADRIMFLTTYTFDASVLEIFWPLATGGTIVIPKLGTHGLPGELLECVSNEKVTILQSSPALLTVLCEVTVEKSTSISLQTLRLIICGSSVLSRRLRDSILSIFNCKLANHYGPTECTVDATCFAANDEFSGDIVPIGRPLPNVDVFVLDDFDQMLPWGVVGNICISSPGLTLGYWQDDSRNKDVFFVKVFPQINQSLRLYRTNDFGKFDENGNLHFCGRRDSQVKVNGNRIEVEEIENILLNHPSVQLAAIKPHKLQDGSINLKAYIELNPNYINTFSIKGVNYYQMIFTQVEWLYPYMNAIHHDTWPKYFLGSPILKKYWDKIYSVFPEYQFCLLDDAGNIAVVANGIPMYWSGNIADLPSGWDEGFERAILQHEQGILANTILGLAGIVVKDFQGKGLSHGLVQGFHKLAKLHGLDFFLGPVRPVGMTDYQISDVYVWVNKKNVHDEPLDYWLRVHKQLGGKVLEVAPKSQLVVASVAEWSKWLGESWQKSGEYKHPSTLQPFTVNIEANEVTYFDPSIWVAHYNLQERPGIQNLVSLSEIKYHLTQHLPSYMLPSTCYILPKLPLTESGKVDSKAIKEPISNVDIDETKQPSNEIQCWLTNCWKKILKIQSIGINQDFFMLGGQSLQVIKMLSEVNQNYNVNIMLYAFYKQATIEHLEKTIIQRVKD